MSNRLVLDYLTSVSLIVKRSSQLVVMSALLAVVAGCSSAASKVETWEGDPTSAATAATLEAPGAIEVKQVNGRSMTNFLMDDLALDYALLPGENEVVFTYKTIWAKSGVVDSGESKVHVVKSEPQVVRFTAEPNAVYKFQYQKPETRQDAEAAMPAFTAAIVTNSGALVARSHAWTPRQVADRTPVSSPAASGGSSEAEGSSGDALQRLKSIWATASEEQKKAFLRWAFE
jgi:uncharacterized protein YccT (UPF0319 family)